MALSFPHSLDYQRDAARRQVQSSLAGVLVDLSLDLNSTAHNTASSLLPPFSHSALDDLASMAAASVAVKNLNPASVSVANNCNALLAQSLGLSSTQPTNNESLLDVGIKKPQYAALCPSMHTSAPPLSAASLLLQGLGLPSLHYNHMESPVRQQPQQSHNEQNELKTLLNCVKSDLLQDVIAQEKTRMIQDAYVNLLCNQASLRSQQSIVSDEVENITKRLLQALKSQHAHVQMQPVSPLCNLHQATSLNSTSAMEHVVATSHLSPHHSVVNAPSAHRVADAIGSQLRAGQPYIDVTALPGMEEMGVVAPRNRGGVTESFPEKLHRMLQESEERNTTDIVSYLPHGRAFCVHDTDAFVATILPAYFKQTKWHSFARQLNLYGFLRVTSGPDCGAYYHELFLKGRPSLCVHMRRVGVPQQHCDRRKFKTKLADNTPDFYAMNALV